MPKELTLKRKEVECLKVNIDDKSYLIPLGKSLPIKTLSKMDNQEEVVRFFEEHLGKEVMDTLTANDFKSIVEAWSEATKEQGDGSSLGES
jgi:hypothetical protein